MTVLDKIIEHEMIGILRGYTPEESVKIAGALLDSDFNVIEVALNSPDAKETLKQLKSNYGSDIVMGAGTVLTVEDAKDCLDIGAEFLLSPVYSEAVMQFSKDNGILYIPGCYTPTEIHNAHASGAEMIKVFPGGQLGPRYIKDVLAPMQDVVLLPTGGVDTDNINDFFAAGAKAVGISSALVPSGSDVPESFLKEVRDRADRFKEVRSER